MLAQRVVTLMKEITRLHLLDFSLLKWKVYVSLEY
jgi:hypothetical protein